jgi:hypothetical protein
VPPRAETAPRGTLDRGAAGGWERRPPPQGRARRFGLDIGLPKRVIEIEPASLPVPEPAPILEPSVDPLPAPEPEPALVPEQPPVPEQVPGRTSVAPPESG